MTREELKKEAKEYVSKYQGWGWTPHEGSAVYNAMLNSYIDSAEPREKRIAEFEAQIEKMKSVVTSERDEALRVEDIITYGVLNGIIDKWEVEER